jgi:viroplasmin and RNaseH domain-containing protein
MSKKESYYVVIRGRVTGIFSTWEECQKSINGYPHNKYYKLSSYEEAAETLRLGDKPPPPPPPQALW